MPPLDCGHEPPADRRPVCPHLLAAEPPSFVERFTGVGTDSALLCEACVAADATEMRSACVACVRDLRSQIWEASLQGTPGVRERATGLRFVTEAVPLPAGLAGRIRDIRPVTAFDRQLWVALTADGELVAVDLDETTARPLARLPDDGLRDRLHLDARGEFAAVVERRGRFGDLFELRDGRHVMRLDRGDYHEEHCDFPAAFFVADGRTLFIHGTAWNRLDISDPADGRLLTAREHPPREGRERLPHDLNYFHCGLTVSPDGRFVADNGWVWHPVGIVTTWSLPAWLANVWESEDGPTRDGLCARSYFWDRPLCWLDERRLAVWGYGCDDDAMLAGVRVFDVEDGIEEEWFAGPAGELACDGEYLHSWGEAGLSAWDWRTGERVAHDTACRPGWHHPGTRTFLAVDGETAHITRLAGHAPAGETVTRLARAMAARREFDALPVLADALEETGTADAATLAHLRSLGPHGRRCWALDRLSAE